MPTVNIITAAGPDSDKFLPTLAESIQAQPAIVAWNLQWSVVADGPDGEENENRARVASTLGATATWFNHTRYWVGASRNRALAHTTADLVTAVDADDVLTPHTFHKWLTSSPP